LAVAGVKDVVINAGGDLRVKTSKPQALWLRDPFQPDHFWPGGYMKDGALASSGGTGAVRDSRQGPHTPLLRPGQSQAPQFVAGVSVLAPTCVVADALTKVALLAPVSLAQKALHLFNAKAWVAAENEGFREISKPSTGIPNRLRKLGA
jgi:thiamine biosynthesis lipoprotein